MLNVILETCAGTLTQGLIYAILSYGIFITYKILDFPDLTVDGSFPLGAAVTAVLLTHGVNAWLTLPIALVIGALAGLCTGLIHVRAKVRDLLVGIITITALYSINIAIMDGASLLSLNKTQTVFSLMKTALAGTPLAGQYKLLTALAAVVLIVLLLTLFLRTRMGLAIRATGNNPDMVRSSSINPAMTTTVGLCIAGSFTALSGCLLAQYQKAADINIGQGMVTIALASLLIGSTILGRGGIFLRAVGAVLGAVVFRLVYTVALRLDMPAFMLKLVSAVIVVLAISIPYLKTQLPVLRRRMQRKAG